MAASASWPIVTGSLLRTSVRRTSLMPRVIVLCHLSWKRICLAASDSFSQSARGIWSRPMPTITLLRRASAAERSSSTVREHSVPRYKHTGFPAARRDSRSVRARLVISRSAGSLSPSVASDIESLSSDDLVGTPTEESSFSLWAQYESNIPLLFEELAVHEMIVL